MSLETLQDPKEDGYKTANVDVRVVQKEDGSETASVQVPIAKRSTFRTVTIILSCFMAQVLNIALINGPNISLADIGKSLHIDQDSLQWVPSAFALSSGCFLLLFGRLADLHGRKATFIFGVIWTLVFCIGCGFAQTGTQLFLLRGLKGIGIAAAIPAALGIIAESFPPGQTRSIAFATFSAGAPFGGGLGYTLGSLVTQYSHVRWRGMFFLLAGIAALNAIAAIFAIDPDKPSTETDRRVDWIGAVLVTSGLVLVTFVLGQGELASQGWRTPYIIALLIVGVFLIGAYIFWEDYLVKHTTRPPLMRLELWTRARGRFAAIQLIAFLNWSAFVSWNLWVQLYYQIYKNETPVKTMIALLPMVVTGLILNFIVGIVVGRLAAIYLLTIGMVATGISCLLMALINTHAPYWAFVFPSTILAVWGTDFIFSCGTIFVARVALPHEQSVAGGVLQTLVQIGTSFGLAITTIVHNKVTRRETSRLGVVPDGTLTNAPPEAQLKGYRAAQWTGFGFAMLALILVLVFFRNVGVVGGKQAKPADAAKDEETPQESMEGKNFTSESEESGGVEPAASAKDEETPQESMERKNFTSEPEERGGAEPADAAKDEERAQELTEKENPTSESEANGGAESADAAKDEIPQESMERKSPTSESEVNGGAETAETER